MKDTGPYTNLEGILQSRENCKWHQPLPFNCHPLTPSDTGGDKSYKSVEIRKVNKKSK